MASASLPVTLESVCRSQLRCKGCTELLQLQECVTRRGVNEGSFGPLVLSWFLRAASKQSQGFNRLTPECCQAGLCGWVRAWAPREPSLRVI